MARKLFVVAGHGGEDTGATGNGYLEKDLTIQFRDIVIAELRALGIEALTDSNMNALRQTLAWLKGKFTSRDILVDIHWNASSTPASKGSEVIIPDESSEFERSLAKDILHVFTEIGFSYRGVKPERETFRKRLGWMRPHAENVLIEVCFITNLTDMKLYEANKRTLGRKLAGVLRDYTIKP